MVTLPAEYRSATVHWSAGSPCLGVRRAFEAETAEVSAALDRTLALVPAALRTTAFAEALDLRRDFFRQDDDRSDEAAQVEAAAFRLATALGATTETVEAARCELDRRGKLLSKGLAAKSPLESNNTRVSLVDLLEGLQEAECLKPAKTIRGDGALEDLHRLDSFLVGDAQGRGLPIIAVVAAICVARRTGLPTGALFGVGAPGRFLLGIRRVGLLQEEEKDDRWFGEYGSHGREILRLKTVTDYPLVAVKITGDDHVPAGEVSWRLLQDDTINDDDDDAKRSLDDDDDDSNDSDESTDRRTTNPDKLLVVGQRLKAELRVADRGFRNARWLEATLVVVSDDEIAIVHSPTLGHALPPLHLRRLRPKSPDSVLFVDCLHDAGKVFTRAQLTKVFLDNEQPTTKPEEEEEEEEEEEDQEVEVATAQSLHQERRPPPLSLVDQPTPSTEITRPTQPLNPDLRKPLPEVDALEIARRICRNVYAAAVIRQDILGAMLAQHAELDIRL